ncbi:MAG: hypothetical protein GY857_12650 [Desulfobacula sp.]|nr:hypothetical protein [Desulfobacula sp.]
MVFFTCVIVVLVLYFLQADGLIFVTIIAVIAELINLFMTQTLTKSVEKQTSKKFVKIMNGYKAKITAQEKSIKEFQDLQEESIRKLHNANLKIKEYEDNSTDKSKLQPNDIEDKKEKKIAVPETPKKKESNPKEFIDLPAGSNRKQLPI